MTLKWFLIFCVGILLLEQISANSVGQPMFYALDNPCMDEYKLCSSSCQVMTLKNDVQCQFCYCQDPNNQISWQSSTVPQTTTNIPLSSSTSGTKSPYLIVNNITYIELQNPCELRQAMCPIVCEVSTVLYHNRTCENCYCSNLVKAALGKRSEKKLDISIRDDHLGSKLKSERDLNSEKIKQKRCMSFFCPLRQCPDGTEFDIGPNGCPMCRCVAIQTGDTTTTSTTVSTPLPVQHHTGPTHDITELFCLSDPTSCPGHCHVHNITVNDWHCYFCRCEDGVTFVALVNPCDNNVRLCPSNCTVRHLTSTVILDSIQCDYCDCNTPVESDVRRTSRFLLSDLIPEGVSTTTHCLPLASDCPSHCHLITVHSNHWKCDVCVCNGIPIPKQFVHHFQTTSFKETHLTEIHHPHSTTQIIHTSQREKINSTPLLTTTKEPLLLSTSLLLTTLDAHRKSSIEHFSTTTTQEPPISCFICNLTNCDDTELHICSKGTDFCMNTLKQTPGGDNIVERSCVKEEDCVTKWWMDTAENPICEQLVNKQHVTINETIECNFCCTENGCNKNLQIDSHLYIGKHK